MKDTITYSFHILTGDPKELEELNRLGDANWEAVSMTMRLAMEGPEYTVLLKRPRQPDGAARIVPLSGV